MATHDRMDLDVRSQAFLKDFYHFHKNSCDAWYIKDANHRFMDASITFLSRFLPPDLTSVVGLGDSDFSIAPERDVSLMHDFESQVIESKRSLILFSYGYMCDKDKVKSFVMDIKPFTLSNESRVMISISELSRAHRKVDWLSPVLGINKISEIDRLLPSYENEDPRVRLTESEWEVAWLLIYGCSIRGVARYLNVSTRTVQVRARSAYINLRVYDKNGLLKIADRYDWINFIPERFLTASSLIRIF